MMPQEIQEKIKDLTLLKAQSHAIDTKKTEVMADIQKKLSEAFPTGTLLECRIRGQETKVLVKAPQELRWGYKEGTMEVVHIPSFEDITIDLSDPDLQPKILYKP